MTLHQVRGHNSRFSWGWGEDNGMLLVDDVCRGVVGRGHVDGGTLEKIIRVRGDHEWDFPGEKMNNVVLVLYESRRRISTGTERNVLPVLVPT